MTRIPRAVAYVDLSAIEKNYRAIKAYLPSAVKVLCVVKADAYGHGAVEVARRLEVNGVDYLGVATIDEGMELRDNGITSPILVMSGIFPWDDVGLVFKGRLTPVVYDSAALDRIADESAPHDKTMKIHVKIDTGMGRLGFSVDDIPYVIERVKTAEKVEVEGLMSHFSVSEVRNDYGLGQVKLFTKAISLARGAGLDPKIIHMANSGALTTYPDAYFGMVRVGINLYGSYPAKELKGKMELGPAMKFVSKISLLRDFGEGQALSYGGTYITKKNTRVAYVPVGYADGYPRTLSNKASVLIRDKRCSILGRICMDWLLVDVTHLSGVDVGEEVVLLGRSDTQVITADELADLAGTIPYEIFCKMSKRIMRVYA
ncbi:MAG: alanine racemase [Syntrophobacterales bacterium]|jgi:alanine racemase|nr:alanine racemase [Syntrophobacterales bacterium]